MSEENVEIVRRLYDRLNRRDSEGIVALFDPAVEYLRTGGDVLDFAGEWHGIEEMRASALDYLGAWEDYTYEIDRIVDLDNRVFVLERQKGRGMLSGAKTTHDVGALLAVRDGLIVRWEQFWDPAEALEAAGLSE